MNIETLDNIIRASLKNGAPTMYSTAVTGEYYVTLNLHGTGLGEAWASTPKIAADLFLYAYKRYYALCVPPGKEEEYKLYWRSPITLQSAKAFIWRNDEVIEIYSITARLLISNKPALISNE